MAPGPTIVKCYFTRLKLTEQRFFAKHLKAKYKISKSRGSNPPASF